MKGSPLDPERTYASLTSRSFCQTIHRPNDGRKTGSQSGIEPGHMYNSTEHANSDLAEHMDGLLGSLMR